MKSEMKVLSKCVFLVLIGLGLGVLFSSGKDHGSSITSGGTRDKTGAAEVWTCSMHPQIKLPKPGPCPLCGMDLILLQVLGDERGERVLAMSHADKKLAEIATLPVERKRVDVPVRLVGKIIMDETKVKTITSWFPYRIDRLFVDYTGIAVREGDHLAEIYSPDLITAQEELLEANRRASEDTQGESPFLKASNSRALESAREKLRLWGLLPSQIREIEERGSTLNHMVINAPVGGTVIHKGVKEGEYAAVGAKIFTIADLRHLWVLLDAYETDLPWIRYGQSVTFQTEAYPGETFQGTITFIDPVLHDASRTVKVRVAVANKDQKLKPEMLVRATVMSHVAQSGRAMAPDLQGKWICPMHPEVIKDRPGPCGICDMDLVPAESLGFTVVNETELPLVVPESAVLRTGKRALVYVMLKDRDRPTYEGREITVGPRTDNFYIVLEGLTEGDEVVVNGNFKIDSALQIQAKPSMMSMPAEEVHPVVSAPAVFRASLTGLYERYFEISEALARDAMPEAVLLFPVLKQALVDVESNALLETAHSATWKKQADVLDGILHAHHGSRTDKELKQVFYDLSQALLQVHTEWGHAAGTYYQMHCPMAMEGRGGEWLQRGREINNPYFGLQMQKCGSVVLELAGQAGAN